MPKKIVENIPSLPADAPLLSLEEAAAYLRIPVGGVRKVLEGLDDGDLSVKLRSLLVVLSPRRRYIKRAEFMAWLNGANQPAPEVVPVA